MFPAERALSINLAAMTVTPGKAHYPARDSVRSIRATSLKLTDSSRKSNRPSNAISRATSRAFNKLSGSGTFFLLSLCTLSVRAQPLMIWTSRESTIATSLRWFSTSSAFPV
jgi:hypothetical protein